MLTNWKKIMTYITLEEIEKTIRPFVGKLEMVRDHNSVYVKDTDYYDHDKLIFCENGSVFCTRNFLVRDFQKFIDKLIAQELIVNWDDNTAEGYFVNKNIKIDSPHIMMAKIHALTEENSKLKKELTEKIDYVSSNLADHEADYKHERTSNYY